jgi:ABC-type Mn2+/Zn2+ transport system ATPase subunit
MATHDVLGSAEVADRVWGINRTVVADVPAALLLNEEVLRRIYGESLLVLPTGHLAVGDQAR